MIYFLLGKDDKEIHVFLESIDSVNVAVGKGHRLFSTSLPRKYRPLHVFGLPEQYSLSFGFHYVCRSSLSAWPPMCFSEFLINVLKTVSHFTNTN